MVGTEQTREPRHLVIGQVGLARMQGPPDGRAVVFPGDEQRADESQIPVAAHKAGVGQREMEGLLGEVPGAPPRRGRPGGWKEKLREREVLAGVWASRSATRRRTVMRNGSSRIPASRLAASSAIRAEASSASAARMALRSGSPSWSACVDDLETLSSRLR